MPDDSKRRIRDFGLGRTSKSHRTQDGLIVADGVLAGPAAKPIASWLADNFNHNFDAYDRAVDAAYNATHVGGSHLHHIVDGQHSILGAFHAVRDVSADDGWATELYQAGEHLLRDTMSVKGISPFFQISQEHYEAVAKLVVKVGISRPYLADALTVNGPELFGGAIALAGSIITARDPDPARLSRLSGAYLVSAAVSANPLLIPIAAGGLAYALVKSDDKREVLIEAGKGAFVSGSALLVASLIGPGWLGLLAGAMTAIAVSQAIDNPEKAWQRAQALIQPAHDVFTQAARQIRTMKYEPA